MAQTAAHNFDVYQPRNPKASAYYQCVENHFEELEGLWDSRYHDPPKSIISKSIPDLTYDFSDPQIPAGGWH